MKVLISCSTKPASLPCLPVGRINVKQEEIDEMLKEAPGPINFTVFLTMFGEKLKGEVCCCSYISFENKNDHSCRKGRLTCSSELLLFRCRPRGDHPERLQGVRP